MVANVLPSNTTIPNVTWSVTPTSLATIDASGKLTALASGKVTVTALAWDGSGTKGTRQITIAVPTGLNDRPFAENIRVYPNPAIGGKFTIDGIQGIKQIDVFDLWGRKVTGFGDLNQPDLNIQLNATPGTYLVNLSDGQQSVYKKIMIK